SLPGNVQRRYVVGSDHGPLPRARRAFVDADGEAPTRGGDQLRAPVLAELDIRHPIASLADLVPRNQRVRPSRDARTDPRWIVTAQRTLEQSREHVPGSLRAPGDECPRVLV